MIIELVLDVVLGILSTLFGLLPSLPSLPAAVTDVWSQILGYLNQGMGFVGSWLYLPVALPCMGIVVAVELWDDFLQNASVVYGKNSFLNIRL